MVLRNEKQRPRAVIASYEKRLDDQFSLYIRYLLAVPNVPASVGVSVASPILLDMGLVMSG